MRKLLIYFTIFTFCLFFNNISAQDLRLIPYPQKVEIKSGCFEMPKTINFEKGITAEKYKFVLGSQGNV